MKRSGPIRRKKSMRRAAPRRVTRPGPGSDPAYLEEVRKLPCCAPTVAEGTPWQELDSVCLGDRVAHHAGPKKNDSTAVPLCWKHHQQWHDANGVFKDWRKAARSEWAEKAIAETRATLTKA